MLLLIRIVYGAVAVAGIKVVVYEARMLGLFTSVSLFFLFI